MQYIIFDDEKYKNFYPLTLTRSTGDLRVGILKLRQRIKAYFVFEENNFVISEKLEKVYRERHPDWKINSISAGETLFINSRLKVDAKIVKKIEELPINTCFMNNNDTIAAKLKINERKISTENISGIFGSLKNIQLKSGLLWNRTWALISENSDYIAKDFKNFFYEKDNFFETEMGVTILNPYDVWIGENVEIKPGVVIDASEGPVVLDESAKVMSNAVIIGPAYIGKRSVIKAGAKIYEGTSIGPVCKVGGEVEESIFQAYSNKQHDGFLGHSYLGEWINLGADTNNSDLKNNYKNVKAYFYPEKKKIDSGTQLLGTIIGDHTKTGINSTINTGAVIGVGCNLFGRNLISDFVSSFSWGESSNLTQYRIDKFLETAELVKKRRELSLTPAEKNLYNNIE